MPTRFTSARWLATAALGCLVALPPAHAASLWWDSAPATAGLQDGAGNWSNLGTLTNWWDGTQNVAWSPGSTAVIGSNLTAAATITLTNSLFASGLIFSNIPISGTAAYTVAASGGSTLSLGGSPALLESCVNYPAAPAGGSANETISASLIATGGLQLFSVTPWVAQVSLNNATNFINGTLEIGTPGNASYTSPTAIQAQFNSSGLGAGALSGCNTLIVHSNASVLLRGTSGAFTLNWPKKFIVSGDGIPSSFFSFGAISFGGNTGSLFPADIQLAGDSTVVGTWGVANAIFTNSGSISGTGRLRFCASANRPTSGTVIFKGKHTYVGDTIFDGTVTVQLASGQDDRLPPATHLKLGTAGLFYGSTSAGVPQSSFNGYGRLVLGDAQGAVNQTLAGLSNEPTLNTGSPASWIVGGNASANSFLTIDNASDWTYNAILGGGSAPAANLGLIKNGAGTLNLQGANQCAGGYTVNAGTLAIGDGYTDYALSGPMTNHATVAINVGSSLTYTDSVSGGGSFLKGGFGTLTLTGTNTATGTFTVQSGTLALNPTLAGNLGLVVTAGSTLQVNRPTATAAVSAANASVDSGSLNLDLDFNLTGPSTTAVLSLSGGLTNNGFTTINLTHVGALALGSFPLIKYGTYQSNDLSSFSVSSFAPGITASIQNNAANHTIDLVISQIAGNALKWTGATDNNWDSSTLDWLNTSSQSTTAYTLGDFVLFDDTATGPTAIQIISDPQPNSLTVSNNTKAYSFNGAGIGGPASLVKQGTGSLTVAVNNSNLGGTQIQRGTLQVGDGAVDGTITAPILDNGALVFNVQFLSSAGDITGTGSVTKTGAGQLTLAGNSAYGGSTLVQQGSLYVQSSSALGASTNGTSVQPGTELWLDAPALNVPEPLVVSGAGITGAGGALNASANCINSVLSGPITATNNAAILAVSGSSLTLAGPVNAGTNALVFAPAGGASVSVAGNLLAKSLAVNDTGRVNLLASNNLSSTTLMLAGTTLYAYHSLALGSNSTVVLSNGVTAGAGPHVGLASNVTIGASVAFQEQIPGGGLPNSYRAYLDFGVAGDATNTLNAPITLIGTDPLASGVPGYCILSANAGLAVVNGNITEAPGQTINVQVRGATNGIFRGIANLDTNAFTKTDLGTWTIASAGHTWGQTIVFQGPLKLGIAEALPASASLRLDGQANSALDLNGFDQHVAGLTNTGNFASGCWQILNTSPSSAATLSYQGGSSLFGGFINASAGAQALSLNVAQGVLQLSATNTFSGKTTIRSGATLGLTGGGHLSGTSLLDVQAGGTLDLTGLSAGSWTAGSATTLGGNGTILGNLVVNGGMAPGASVGQLNVTGNVALNGSAVTTMEVNKSANTNDLLSVTGTLTYGGALVLTNLSATAYAANDVFKLFNASSYSGSFTGISFPGVSSYDASRLGIDGTIKVLSVLPNTPTNLSFTLLTGNNLQLSWPSSYTGWSLQTQTNPPGVGLRTNWVTVPGSLGTNKVTLPIDPAAGSQFFRLALP